MRIVRKPGKFYLHFNTQEKLLWLEVLELYPRVPPAHLPLSKGGRLPDQPGNQQLLEEALAEQRAKNKRQIEELQADPRRWTQTKSGFGLSLSRAEVEWLLQVFNDIRVGSWVRLGSPEELAPAPTQENLRGFWAMELSGQFQAGLLGALEGGAITGADSGPQPAQD